MQRLNSNKTDTPVIVNPTPTADPKPNLTKDFFPLWNKCEALTVLQEYVEDVTNPKSPNFISAEDRIATFDMDGTFIGELYPTYFEYNMFEYRALDDPDYKDIAPDDVREAAQDIRDFEPRKETARPFRHEACLRRCQGLLRHDHR